MVEKTKSLTQRLAEYWPVAAILAGIILAGVVCYYIERTLVDTWIVVVVSAVIAIVPVLRLLRRGDDGWVWYLFKVAGGWFAGSMLVMCVIMALNYHLADAGTLHGEQVTVESRYTETRYRKRRVGRRYVGQGTPYNVYRVTVRFESGAVKEFSVPQGRYNRARSGNRFTVDVADGLFGMPVLHRHDSQAS